MTKRMIILMTLLFILSGCGNGDRYNFSGSSENWDVFYVVDVSGGNSQEEKGTVKFTGGEGAPETIDIKLETKAGGAGSTGLKLDDGAGNFGQGACSGCAVVQEDEEIEVEITWNGQTESLVLTNGE